MIFVKCDERGQVVAIGTEAPAEAEGWSQVEDGDARVAEFCRRVASGGSELNQSDTAFIRVLEDVIDLLVDRSVIMFTDLPQAAQQKLMARRNARARMRGEFRLIDDEQGLL